MLHNPVEHSFVSVKTVAKLVILSPIIIALVILPSLLFQMSSLFGALRHAFAGETRRPEHGLDPQSAIDELLPSQAREKQASNERNVKRDSHDHPMGPGIHTLATQADRSSSYNEDDHNESRYLSTEGDTSNADDSLLSADVYLGPQMTPYVHRRDRTQSGPPTPAAIENLPSRQQMPNAPGHFSSRDIEQILQVAQPQPVTISAPSLPMSTSTDGVPLFTPRITTSLTRLSSWRQEQLKNMKQGRVTSSQPRKIASLHGTLSLPYARNPSGVDSAVHDDDALMHLVQDSDYGRSDTTARSGAEAPRSRSYDTDRTVPRPLERKDPTAGQSKGAGYSSRGTMAQAREDKENLPLSQDSDITQRVPRIALSTIHMPQAGLPKALSKHLNPSTKIPGVGLGIPALPTIPGSPSTDTPSESRLFSDDYHSSATNDFTSLHYSSDERKTSWGTGSGTPSMSGGSRIPSDGSTQSSLIGSGGQYSKGSALVDASTGSKADSSANWRFRKMDIPNNKVVFSTPAKASKKSENGMLSVSPLSLPPDVLTIDALFQRFNGKDDPSNVPFKAPGVDPAIKQVSDRPFPLVEMP